MLTSRFHEAECATCCTRVPVLELPHGAVDSRLLLQYIVYNFSSSKFVVSLFLSCRTGYAYGLTTGAPFQKTIRIGDG